MLTQKPFIHPPPLTISQTFQLWTERVDADRQPITMPDSQLMWSIADELAFYDLEFSGYSDSGSSGWGGDSSDEGGGGGGGGGGGVAAVGPM